MRTVIHYIQCFCSDWRVYVAVKKHTLWTFVYLAITWTAALLMMKEEFVMGVIMGTLPSLFIITMMIYWYVKIAYPVITEDYARAALRRKYSVLYGHFMKRE